MKKLFRNKIKKGPLYFVLNITIHVVLLRDVRRRSDLKNYNVQI